MQVREVLKDAVQAGASDIFIIAGLPLSYKVSGHIVRQHEQKLGLDQTREILEEIYELAGSRSMKRLLETGDDDFSFAIPGLSRFRASAYRQRGSLASVIRVVNFELPRPELLGIPEQVLALAERKKGLVLVTGSAGSGKSTTLACMIDRINSTRNLHVITLEDPLEYLHGHKKSIISQREISSDTESYVSALRAALRQSPDVILLGEMRDHETMNVAMTAAETGHLVISTLHTVGAANTIDRVIDAFPPSQQQQIRIQFSMVLQAVVSQQLIPTVDSNVIPAFEIMLANTAIRNMIREAKTHQIDTVIAANAASGMRTMDASLLELCSQGRIAVSDALTFATNPDMMEKRLPRR